MTNTRFPGRPGWRAGRATGTHRTRVRHDDVIVPSFPSASAPLEGNVVTTRVRERLAHFRNTFGCSSDEEDFAGYPDPAIEDVANRYQALVRAAGVVTGGQDHWSVPSDHRNRPKQSSPSIHPTRYSLSSPVIPRLRGSVPVFRGSIPGSIPIFRGSVPGSIPRPSGSIHAPRTGTVPVPGGSVLDQLPSTLPALSRSIPGLFVAVPHHHNRFVQDSKLPRDPNPGQIPRDPNPGQIPRDPNPGQIQRDPNPGQIPRDLNPGQTNVFRPNLELHPSTDVNHNLLAPPRPSKVRSGKVGSLWQCRRKGFERRWIRKRDAAIYGRSPSSRLRAEEKYLVEEDIPGGGRISPDSGNDSAQSFSSSPTNFSDLMTRKSSSLSSASSTLTFDLPTPSSPTPSDRTIAGLTPPPPSLPAAAAGASHWRKRRCRRCSGCLSTDCGVCYACRDMVKYGGRGISKQACCRRRCRQPMLPSDHLHHHHRSPSPKRTPSAMRTDSSSNSSTTSGLLPSGGQSSVSTGWQFFRSKLPTSCRVQGITDEASSSLVTPDGLTTGSEVIRSPGTLPPNKLSHPLLRPPLLSSPSRLLTGNPPQGSGNGGAVMPQSDAADKDAIWASIVKLVDEYLLEQLRQKRDIDKSLEDSLYSSIRDLVKTILPTPANDPRALGSAEATEETNPTGCARAIPFSTRKPRDLFSFLLSEHRRHLSSSEANRSNDEMIFDQTQRRVTSFGGDMSATGRFRQMNRRPLANTVYVARSDIHSRGLFGARDIEAGEALVEYTGQVIRAALTDKRERDYEGLGVGCYMFRLDKTRVVDATLMGSAARFINHSCEPNCYSRVVQSSTGVKHIVIFSLRDIKRGEELTYDYKFPIENIKIPCSCGSKKCRKYLN